MNLKLMEEKDRLIACISGEIDHHSALALREKVDRQIAALRPKELVIDLAAVDFMDSSGLGFIMGRYRSMAALRGRVVVAGAKGRVEAVLVMAGVYRYVEKREQEVPV
ncbi:MAG: anti-sigma factor antagonist [Clostridia bacterium]|nr:anti-sigma factor antagonist [Clostridia bacterium]